MFFEAASEFPALHRRTRPSIPLSSAVDIVLTSFFKFNVIGTCFLHLFFARLPTDCCLIKRRSNALDSQINLITASSSIFSAFRPMLRQFFNGFSGSLSHHPLGLFLCSLQKLRADRLATLAFRIKGQMFVTRWTVGLRPLFQGPLSCSLKRSQYRFRTHLCSWKDLLTCPQEQWSTHPTYRKGG